MKKSINIIISLLLTFLVLWLSFYGGHLLKIGDPNQDAPWYVVPYVVTCLVAFVLCIIYVIECIDKIISN
jgi:hypothetical protein